MATRMEGVRLRTTAVLGGLRTTAARLERVRPVYVVGAFVVAEWLATLGLALSVRHNRWFYYHGGDQVWFYTTSWLLKHGQLVPTHVGYGWSVLLMPLTLGGGPNLIQVLPAIVLIDVLLLMPVAMIATYGIGERIGGRLFGYWVLVVWLVLPFVGIKYTDTGFKQRYTELALPDGFGLTSLSDFPHMVMLAVSAYFCLRVVQRPAWADGLLAGLFAGFAIGIKPSSSLFLVAVVLVLVGCRRWRALPAFAAGLAPCIVALTFWKWRGLGYVPLFHAEHAVRLALGGGGLPLGGVHPGRYVNLDWGRLQQNLDTLGEHFWSERVVEWTVIAGIIALGRRSLAAMLLVGGWLAAFLLVKGTGRFGILETGGLLHMLVPAIPPFVVIVAALPFLVPGAARRLRPVRPPRDWGTPQLRTAAVVAATLLFAVAPVALAASAHRATPGSGFVFVNAGPIPVDPGLDLRAVVEGPRVHLTWTPRHAAGAPLFYELVRDTSPSTAPPCPEPWGGICWRPVAVKRGTEFVDKPPAGGWTYRVLVEATWIDRLTTGDDYLASEPVSVRVP